MKGMGFFHGDETALNFIVVMDAQLYEYTKTSTL
jgi:hypothetical protein